MEELLDEKMDISDGSEDETIVLSYDFNRHYLLPGVNRIDHENESPFDMDLELNSISSRSCTSDSTNTPDFSDISPESRSHSPTESMTSNFSWLTSNQSMLPASERALSPSSGQVFSTSDKISSSSSENGFVQLYGNTSSPSYGETVSPPVERALSQSSEKIASPLYTRDLFHLQEKEYSQSSDESPFPGLNKTLTFQSPMACSSITQSNMNHQWKRNAKFLLKNSEKIPNLEDAVNALSVSTEKFSPESSDASVRSTFSENSCAPQANEKKSNSKRRFIKPLIGSTNLKLLKQVKLKKSVKRISLKNTGPSTSEVKNEPCKLYENNFKLLEDKEESYTANKNISKTRKGIKSSNKIVPSVYTSKIPSVDVKADFTKYKMGAENKLYSDIEIKKTEEIIKKPNYNSFKFNKGDKDYSKIESKSMENYSIAIDKNVFSAEIKETNQPFTISNMHNQNFESEFLNPMVDINSCHYFRTMSKILPPRLTDRVNYTNSSSTAVQDSSRQLKNTSPKSLSEINMQQKEESCNQVYIVNKKKKPKFNFSSIGKKMESSFIFPKTGNADRVVVPHNMGSRIKTDSQHDSDKQNYPLKHLAQNGIMKFDPVKAVTSKDSQTTNTFTNICKEKTIRNGENSESDEGYCEINNRKANLSIQEKSANNIMVNSQHLSSKSTDNKEINFKFINSGMNGNCKCQDYMCESSVKKLNVPQNKSLGNKLVKFDKNYKCDVIKTNISADITVGNENKGMHTTKHDKSKKGIKVNTANGISKIAGIQSDEHHSNCNIKPDLSKSDTLRSILKTKTPNDVSKINGQQFDRHYANGSIKIDAVCHQKKNAPDISLEDHSFASLNNRNITEIHKNSLTCSPNSSMSNITNSGKPVFNNDIISDDNTRKPKEQNFQQTINDKTKPSKEKLKKDDFKNYSSERSSKAGRKKDDFKNYSSERSSKVGRKRDYFKKCSSETSCKIKRKQDDFKNSSSKKQNEQKKKRKFSIEEFAIVPCKKPRINKPLQSLSYGNDKKRSDIDLGSNQSINVKKEFVHNFLSDLNSSQNLTTASMSIATYEDIHYINLNEKTNDESEEERENMYLKLGTSSGGISFRNTHEIRCCLLEFTEKLLQIHNYQFNSKNVYEIFLTFCRSYKLTGITYSHINNPPLYIWDANVRNSLISILQMDVDHLPDPIQRNVNLKKFINII